jgi:hypothetical protein
MILDDLTRLLEGCPLDAEVRLAVEVSPGQRVEFSIVGITSANRLPPADYVLGQGDPEPGVVWILNGAPLGPVNADHWDPRYRRQP